MVNSKSKWLMKLDTPSDVRQVADTLWRNGFRNREDLIAIGYDEHECNVIIARYPDIAFIYHDKEYLYKLAERKIRNEN